MSEKKMQKRKENELLENAVALNIEEERLAEQKRKREIERVKALEMPDAFQRILKKGIYKELHKRGVISGEELNELLKEEMGEV